MVHQIKGCRLYAPKRKLGWKAEKPADDPKRTSGRPIYNGSISSPTKPCLGFVKGARNAYLCVAFKLGGSKLKKLADPRFLLAFGLTAMSEGS